MARSRIIETLQREARTVEELGTILGDAPETLREHLAVLEANDMVNANERPETTEYVLTDGAPTLAT